MNEFGQKGEHHYLAIIGDLERSREVRDRAATQSRLEAALETVNRKLGKFLAAKFILTLGDEFQGLIKIPGDSLFVIDSIHRDMEGLPIRYGLGWGGLSTKLKDEAIGMDGPCFHAAREAVLRAKSEDRRIVLKGFGEERDLALNGVFGLMDGIRRRWKPAQEETVRLMSSEGMRQKDVAQLRGVSNSVVSETLKSALHKQMAEANMSLWYLMNDFAEMEDSLTSGKVGP